ncbi:hypothetical protein OB69_13400 [Roseivirga seohaensis subsp. aquiponti]|uniref:DUF6602 domain-containing protein n=1 Tax=Roseivirga seohaensis subsp. aquiponti TaxID=1566026 RepID=A0A0L8AIH2_9BACT|nr:DUF6602 domain-containing protein [Roseivirga seohaensis]KOF02223.1 hypothetical protein OB69_13400 [Roseivirga seohaensis subsp. aquiponti]
MARIQDLIEVHLKETEAVIAQSKLLLQKHSYGQSGELKSAGNLVESYIRNFISQISPDAIKVTSGYVVNPKILKSEINLAQHDIILANKATPPIFSIVNNEIDVVPIESMVGIIEVKRTLTRESIKSAFEQISNTYENVIKGFRKKDEGNNSLSVTIKPGTRSPMFGIIGLESQLTKKDIEEVIDPKLIDFVWAFNHNEAFIVGDNKGNIRETVSRRDNMSPRMLCITGTNSIVFSKIKGTLSLWLSSLASLYIQPDNITGYYFDVWNDIEI